MSDKFNADEKLKLALERYTESWLEGLPSDGGQTADPGFSPDFEKKMNRLVSREKLPYYQWINTLGKRVAVFAISLIIVLAAMVTGVKALRDPVVHFAVRAYEKISTITVNKRDVPDETGVLSADPQRFELTVWQKSGNAPPQESSDQNAAGRPVDKSAPKQTSKPAETKEPAAKDTKSKAAPGVCTDGQALQEIFDEHDEQSFDWPDEAEDDDMDGQDDLTEQPDDSTQPDDLIDTDDFLNTDDQLNFDGLSNFDESIDTDELIDTDEPIDAEEPIDMGDLIVSDELIGLPEPIDLGSRGR